MKIEQLREFTPQLMQTARRHGIARVYVIGSVARGEATAHSDIDFLVDMTEGASLFGVAGFLYEAEKLLGVRVDVIPTPTLQQVKDKEFVLNIQGEAILL